MNLGKLVFSQLMAHLPLTTFRRCVARYRGHFKVKSFTCFDQYLCMAFAQLTCRESLRDIEACLRAHPPSSITWAFAGPVSRSTLADANASATGASSATWHRASSAIARLLYADDPLASI